MIKNRIMGRKRTFTRVSNYFSKIDSLSKGYILGFIAADGCITDKNRLVIRSLNNEVLQFIASELQYQGKIILVDNSKIREINKGQQDIWQSSIRDNLLRDDLIKLGITFRKSYQDTFNLNWNLIPKKYWSGVILGIFDGDGCVDVNKRQLRFRITSSSLVFLKQIQEILVTKCDLQANKITKRGGKREYTILYHGNKQVYRIYKYLYTNIDFCLERKKKRFTDVYLDYEKEVNNEK